MVMNEQIIVFAQNYLATLLSINILLSSMTSFLIWNSPKKCFKFSFFASLALYVIAITAILYSYESFFDLLLYFTPDKNINIKEPFKILDIIFWLDLFGLIITTLTFLRLPLKDKK